ncbi:hypothetical protein [Methanococcoides sp. NM1]|uniref:hypothetical protein n=1 Tax=Methanococcoides sp. NM1 TaxID=1201013 RepID=UPI0010825BBF|nr:hypothetical protein [Methanococcoides sp. NM1]
MDQMKNLRVSVIFSLMSYSLVLCVIIFLDVLWRGDFIFKEVAMISGGYMGLVIVFLLIEFVVQRIKIRKLDV